MGPSCKRLLVAHGLPGEGLAPRGAFTSFLPSVAGLGLLLQTPAPNEKRRARRVRALFVTACDYWVVGSARCHAQPVSQIPAVGLRTRRKRGAVAERLKAAVLKTVVRGDTCRGFDSHPLLHSARFCSSIGYLLWWIADASCFRVCRPPAQARRRHRSSLSGSLSASPRCCGLKLGWSRLSGAPAPA